jgi:putative transposase
MIVKAANTKKQGLTRTELAKQEGISRSSLYYRPKMPSKDWLLKNQIEKVLAIHPSYGHRRLAIILRVNKKRISRVMRIFGLKPYRRRGKKYRKTKDLGKIFPNLIQNLPFPQRPNVVWVSDFTRIPFHGRALYLATIADVYNRQVVGWALLSGHSVQLPLTALMNALDKYGRPLVLHSDQGSEYKARIYTGFAQSLGIRISMSHKASPWENGYQESFYGQFKVDLADPNRYKSQAELAVAIYRQIYYYNNLRIHTKLKMPPAIYASRHQLTTKQLSVML